MATPTNKTIKNLNGSWTMDKSLSSPTENIFKLQGLGWVLRKAIGVATITLHIHAYPDTEDSKILHVNIDQTVTGGLKGTTEIRVTDGKERDHKDHIFGSNKGESYLIRAAKGDDGKTRPKFQVRSKVGNEADDAKVAKFLRGEILADGSPSEGFLVDDEGEEYGEGEGLYLQSWVVNLDSGWTAEQIWGFEIVNGERRYARRVAVVKDGKYELARLVYSYVEN